MGQWGLFSQIKHEAYPEPLNCSASVSVRYWWAEQRAALKLCGKSGGNNG